MGELMARSALCIGINDYPGTGSDLAGCVNDARDWAAALSDRGFSVTEMLDRDATRKAMKDGFESIVSGATSDDTVVITYSGHGTWQPDEDGDEPDTRDEALCPHDLDTKGPLLDDDLFDIFNAAERGARVVFLSDSCHSGSVARLAAPDDDQGDRIRFLAPETFLSEEALDRARKAEHAPVRGLSRRTALLISGCKDIEYSYDATFGGRPNGAFTYFALKRLEQLPADATYVDWHREIRTKLPSARHPQTPQLRGSRPQRRWPVLGG
jgi:hypothetical protein